MNSFEKDYSEIIQKLADLQSVKPAEKFRLRVQNLLIPSLPYTSSAFWPVLPLRLAVTSIFLVFLVGSGLAFAAEKSNPGDILYPVKIASEKAQLTLTQSNSAKALLHLSNADKRVSEMKVSVEKNDAADLNNLSVNYSANVDMAIKELEKINNQKEDVEKTINHHLEEDGRQLQEFKSVAPTAAQPAIQKAIDAAREGHDETEKIKPEVKKTEISPTNVIQIQQSEEKKSQENSNVQGVSDSTKKLESTHEDEEK